MTSCEVIIVILMDINHMIQFSESTYIKSSHKSINLTNHTTLEKSPEENAITTQNTIAKISQSLKKGSLTT